MDGRVTPPAQFTVVHFQGAIFCGDPARIGKQMIIMFKDGSQPDTILPDVILDKTKIIGIRYHHGHDAYQT